MHVHESFESKQTSRRHWEKVGQSHPPLFAKHLLILMIQKGKYKIGRITIHFYLWGQLHFFWWRWQLLGWYPCPISDHYIPPDIIQHSNIPITVHLPHKNFFKIHWYISIPARRNIPNVYHREGKKADLKYLKICLTQAASSGPIPSPGIRVTVCRPPYRLREDTCSVCKSSSPVWVLEVWRYLLLTAWWGAHWSVQLPVDCLRSITGP